MKCVVTLFLSFAVITQSNDSASVDKENPYVQSKVGDWATFSCTTNTFAPYKATVSVISSDEKEVVLITDGTINGKECRHQTKVDLKSPIDPLNPPQVMGSKPIVKKLGAGKEKITIGDKTFNCDWLHWQTTITVGGLTVSYKTKNWVCKDVPCGGVVKSEFEGNGMKLHCELVQCGTKK